MKRLASLLAAGALALAFTSPARAEVWGYVDDKGIAHFAAEKVDERYELFFRGGDAPVDAALKAASETPRAVAVPTAPPRLIAFFEVSPTYKAVRHHMRAASSANKVDYELLQALIATESGFDSTAVSPKGAVGLMQIMPATAQRYGVEGDRQLSAEKKLADPGTNIKAGTRYLRYLLDMFPGKTELALAAYNAGEGAVQRAGNQIPNYRETQNYVKTVMQIYQLLKPPSFTADARKAVAPMRAHVQVAGGAIGRGNMIGPLGLEAALPALPEFKIERD